MFNKTEYNKQYRKKNLEHLIEHNRQYRKNNRDKIKERDRKYYKKHLGKHRLVMEKILKRKLREEEQVHHIDMDRTNNNPENLYVYNGKTSHMKGHVSFTKLAKVLIKNNIIEFEDETYYLKK